MKKISLSGRIFLGLGFFLILVAVSFFWWKQQLQPLTDDTVPEVMLVINQGDTASQIIDNLAERQLIRSAFAAKLFFRLFGSDNWIKPGAYLFSSNSSVNTIFENLRRGPKDIWVTIPEGWRREQISARLADRLTGFDSAQFDRISAPLEGRLFPDTYLIPVQATPTRIVDMFLANFSRRTGSSPEPSDHQDTLIIASLIEREAANQADRALISGIIHKRLRNNWPLQIDATVQYAIGSLHCASAPAGCNWWPRVDNTQIPSQFNTYLNLGLPPSPICNPGLASIRAAESPADSPYWYYLTGTDKTTYYAATLSEHNQNIDKYLRR